MDSKPLKLENINSIQQFAELVTELIVKKLPVRDIYINKLSANEDNKVFYEFNDKCEDTTQIVPTNGKKSAWKEFQAKYRSYKSQPDRLQQIFTVEKKEIMNNVNNIVACVGCKGSMDSRFGNLPKLQTKSKLHPFYLNERNGVVNLSESITDNCELLFNILHSQDNKPIPCSSEHSTSVNSSRKINRRCPKHLIDAKKPDHITVDQWLEIWNFINDDTKQDAFSINYSDLFSFMTTYFNNHRNCDDCIDNILDAYQSITKVKIDAFESKEWIAAGCEGYKSIPGMKHITIPSDRKNSIKMICNNGLTKGMIENHAIDGSSAKTELLTCISGFMARRFCQLYILLHKDLQSWKLLYHIAIQCFKNNFYSRYSIADLTKLCAELEDNGNDGRNGKCKKKQRYRKRRKIAKQQVMHTDPSISKTAHFKDIDTIGLPNISYIPGLPISELKNIIPATCDDAKDVGDVADDAINELARYTAKKLHISAIKNIEYINPIKNNVGYDTNMENKAGSRNLNDGNVVKAEHLGDANKIEKMNDVSDKRNTNGVSKRRRRKKIDDDLSDLTQENIDEYYRQAQEFKVDVKGFVRRLKLGVYCLHGMQSITTKFDYSEIDREKLYERCISPLSNSSEYRFCNDNYQRRSFDSLNDNYSFIDQLEKDTKIANEEKSDSLSTLESSDQSSDTSSDDASIPLYNDGCIISSNFYRDSGSESSTSACKDIQTDDQKQQEEHEREKQIRNKQILDVIERLQARHRNY